MAEITTRRRQVAFASGDLTTSAPIAILAFFQLYFLTDVAGLGPALASWPIVISKIWDAFNDPLIGVIADRVSSRRGRRRVLMIGAAPVVSALFGVMWLVPSGAGPVGLVAFYTVVYVLFDTAYTVLHVGYNSLTPLLTDDYDEQSSLNGTRMFFSIGGSLAAVIVVALLQRQVGDERRMFALLGPVLALLVLFPPYVAAAVTRSVDRQSPPGGRPPVAETLRTVFTTRAFLSVALAYLLSWSAVSIVAADLAYFARYYLMRPEQASTLVLIAQGSALALIPAVVWVARRTSKSVAMVLAMGTMAPLLLAIAAMPAARFLTVSLLAASLGFGIAATYVLPWAMIPDVITAAAVRSGLRVEASFYAVIAFIQKSGTAIAIWLMARVFASSGYLTPAAGEVVIQPESAVRAIRFFVGPVPALLVTLAAFVAAAYPVTRARHAESVALSASQD